ncbi:hypothetical protein GQ600_3265 [Phytophthora cactorum]|nr:hypothetical protein GQ600_3265 [Phytophthora cactorum]
MGWVSISEVNITYSYVLLRLVSDEACAAKTKSAPAWYVQVEFLTVTLVLRLRGFTHSRRVGTTEDVLIGFVSWGIGDSCG